MKPTCAHLALISTFLGACGDAGEPPKPAVEIAWISKGRCNSFFDISRFGTRLAGQELEANEEVDLHVDLLEPDDCPGNATVLAEVPEECAAAAPQMTAVQDAIDRRVQAIAISVSNPGCLTPLLDQAVDQGIKVLTFDADAPNSRRHVYYGMDNRAAGRLVARTLADFLGETGKVAIQTAMSQDADGNYHLSTSTSYVERMAGIEEGLAEYPSLELVATVPCIGNDVLDPSCAKEIESLLDDETDLAGLVLSRGKVLREVNLAANAPSFTASLERGQLRSVGFDAPDDAISNIKAGYAGLVIAQKQFGWGYDVTRLAYDMVVNGAEPAAYYDSGWYAVCPNNVLHYESMWNNQDFRGELEACSWGE
jgi:ribose transport system substrate-binding protein